MPTYKDMDMETLPNTDGTYAAIGTTPDGRKCIAEGYTPEDAQAVLRDLIHVAQMRQLDPRAV
jgi:hypothetical protein